MITGMQEIKLNNYEKQQRWNWEHIQVKLFHISIKSLALGQCQQTVSSFINQLFGLIISFTVGAEEMDMERMMRAIEVANIQEFIDSLPLGLDTRIGMEGNGISFGQRQRILIARVVYKQPDFLFFDEATNSLDSNNERVIMENMKEVYKGKTVVVVAHRLSTVPIENTAATQRFRWMQDIILSELTTSLTGLWLDNR